QPVRGVFNGAVLDFRVGDGGADGERGVLGFDVAEFGDALDVDEVLRAGEAEIEYGTEGLTAGEQAGGDGGVGKEGVCFVDGAGAVICEGSGFHRAALMAARMRVGVAGISCSTAPSDAS